MNHHLRSIFLSGITAVMLASGIMPDISAAQTSRTSNPVANPPGIVTWTGVGGDLDDCTNLPQFAAYSGGHCITNPRPFLQNILNDIANTGGLRRTAASANMRFPDAFWSGQNTPGHPDVQPTIDRMCLSTFPADDTMRATAFRRPGSNGGGTAGGDERTTMVWTGSYWQLYRTNRDYVNGINWNRVVSGLTCTSYSAPHQTLGLSSYTINQGDSAQLSWDDTQWVSHSSDTCTMNFDATKTGSYTDWQCEPTDSFWGDQYQYCWDNGTVEYTYTPTSGSITVSPPETTTYTYSCTNVNGTTEVSAKLTVIPTAPVMPAVTAFTATPSSIEYGASSTLAWSSEHADSCAGSGFETSGKTSGSVSVSPTVTKTYGVTCSNAAGQDTKYATVTVTNPPLSASCSPGTLAAATGQPVSWYASATGGTGSFAYSWSFNGGTPASGSGSSASTKYGSPGTYDASVSVTTPDGQSKTVECASPVTVTPPSNQPDLTAGLPSADIEPAVGAEVTFTAPILNIGGIPASSFFNIFQINQRLEDGSWTGFGAPFPGTPIGGLAAGKTAVTTTSWAPNTPGEYEIRACADQTTSWGSSVNESNENNNCGPEYAFTVRNGGGDPYCELNPDAPECTNHRTFCQTYPDDPSCKTGGGCPPGDASCTTGGGCPSGDPTCTTGGGTSSTDPTAAISVDDPEVLQGNGTTLHWSSTHASSCTGTGFFTSGATSGNTPTGKLTTPGPVQYSVQCDGANGKKGYASVIITVRDPKLSITATPANVRKGQTTHLVWSAKDAGPCIVKSPTGTISTGNSNKTTFASAADPVITQQTVYTLQCDAKSMSVTVGLLPTVTEQ